MTSNKKENLIIIIKWTKRFFAIGGTIAWIIIIYTISTSTMDFNEQAPYCMGSTMLIFMILNGIYKGLDYWLVKEGKA